MATSHHNIIIRAITVQDKADYEQVYHLREEMLRKPIGLSLKDEDLGADAEDTIIVADDNGTITGCTMIHPTGEAGVIKIRQMAVAEGQQGKGIGRMLMMEAERHIWDKGYRKIKLHARITAEGFYKRLGYVTVSDVFTEVGIPHVIMEKERR